MKQRFLVAPVALLALGCGEASTPVASNRPTDRGEASASTDQESTREAAAVAERFVRAIVAGDRAAATRELTANAAARVAREPELLQPLGLPTAELRIGEVRLLGPSEAAVQVLITESGAAEADEVGCLLKLDGARWGVCGLASDAGGGAEPIVIGFETMPQVPSQAVDATQPGDAAAYTARPADGAATR